MLFFKKFITLFVICPLAFGQTQLSKEQVLEDYMLLKNILQEVHPALYEYTSESQWDALFQNFERVQSSSITNSDELFKELSKLTENVKDGHLSLLHPKMENIPPMFPLWLKIIDGKLFVDVENFDIPVGSEITKVNDITAGEIITSLIKYTSSDGYALSRKHRQIESEFSIFHFYEYGQQPSYQVEYQTPDRVFQTKEIGAQAFEKIGRQSLKRNSFFAQYHNYQDNQQYVKERIAERWPFLYFYDDLDTAVLTVHSFALDPKTFKSKLIELFKTIKKKNTKNLIIDIRQNDGGYRINAINLYSLLTDKTFKQRTSETVLLNKLPYQEHIVHTPSPYQGFFKMYFDKAERKADRWILRKDHAKGEMIPAKNPFKGKVYVLIGGKTFSAGTEFAINAKNDKNIILVGEETGGGYYFHVGQFPVVYELPNSKILARISIVKINHFVADKSLPKGSGVLPDKPIPLTVEDLITGTDTQLNYILNKIKREK